MMMQLIVLIACVIQGEAGGLGNPAMFMVADTMAYRYETTQNWDDVLKYYYGYNPEPSEFATTLATHLVNKPWKSVFQCPFAYSDSDRYTQGWSEGDYTYKTLHLKQDWPGE